MKNFNLWSLRYKLVYLIVFILNNSLFSQHGWFWQNPLPTSNTVYRVKYWNNNLAYGVGDFGTVFKTSDSGSHWVLLQNFTSSNFRNLYLVDSNIIFIVGENGSIYNTTNSGVNWNKIDLGVSTTFNDLTFTNNVTGYIVGDQILKTTNLGINWIAQNGYYHLNSICFINEVTGYIAGDLNKVYKSSNSGSNWELISPSIYSYWNSIFFKDSVNGLLFSNDGKIIKTTDGGIVWNQSLIYNNTGFISHYELNNNIYLGGNGILLKTTNFGVNWLNLQTFPNSNFVSSIKVFNDSTFNILLSQRNFSSASSMFDLLATTNNGYNWISQTYGYKNELFNSVKFFNSNTGIISAQGKILRTSNCGNNWNVVYTYPSNLKSINIFDNGHAYTSGGNIFLKSTDFGETWNIVTNSILWGSYPSISFINENNGLLLGYASNGLWNEFKLWKTTNGGITWMIINNLISGTPNNVKMIDEMVYYIVGTNVLKTSNGGNNWYNMDLPTNHKTGIYFFNALTGIVGGVGGTYRTSNGGINWTQVYDGYTINNFDFVDQNIGIGVGYSYSDTRMIKTINGGISWTAIHGITANENTSVEMIDEDTIYVVGYAGLIIKTTNGGNRIFGIIHLSENNPYRIFISQNYPNPFNPETNIKYEIKKFSKVKISVFDILGNEISVLVNNELSPGLYSAEWNASGYASGVYFCRIEAEEKGGAKFTDSKKMVLIK